MTYTKQNPWIASVKSRIPLTRKGSDKDTLHIVLDIRGSGLKYEVGDSIGILPQHDEELVNRTILALRATGSELVQVKNLVEKQTIRAALTALLNITDISPKLIKEIYSRQTNMEKKYDLETLLQDTHREELKAYISKHEVWDLLVCHQEVTFSAQECVDLLMPLLPRFYSIASSQKFVGEEIHLTVAPLEYESNGHKRRGVCTHFICEIAEVDQPMVPLFLQPTHSFRLPEDHSSDLIMIGPGTGVAPFRAFLQERILSTEAKGKHWLFFGERNRETNFFYEEDWKILSQKGHLRLDTAFSRDQPEKVYVQHLMYNYGSELFEWLEKGAYIYVCGDAKRMAKDVELTLQTIIQDFGGMDELQSREYIKRLRQQKRYLRDVY